MVKSPFEVKVSRLVGRIFEADEFLLSDSLEELVIQKYDFIFKPASQYSFKVPKMEAPVSFPRL
jgi:hypothetical protein